MNKNLFLILFFWVTYSYGQNKENAVEIMAHFGLNINSTNFTYDVELNLHKKYGFKYIVLGQLNEYSSVTIAHNGMLLQYPIRLYPKKSTFVSVFKNFHKEKLDLQIGAVGNYMASSAENETFFRPSTGASSALGLYTSLHYNRFCLDVLVPYYFNWKFVSPKFRVTILLFKN